MNKNSKISDRAYNFWKTKIDNKVLLVKGTEFPDEYVRKMLIKEDLLFPVKKGLYILKDKGSEGQNLLYQLYWKIIEKILKPYLPWSIERESALKLYLGNENIPLVLKVRTTRKVRYYISIPFDLKIQVCVNPDFHAKTTQIFEIDKTSIYIDIPERILLSIRNRNNKDFVAFMKGIKFNKHVLEVLYSSNPKPVTVKKLIEMADRNGVKDLSKMLKEIIKEYTIYRV